ncbi:SdrD B-like domain-containing protein [Pseudoxanthomonas sp. JBR18]|uniref:SdrD B-like domain-containing protein n=1 Tax=Pseudoxanthomonas sp. JBR18 TaxID=2969308 RepID=UPI002305E14C|nr:SdrD B-like domain-containing protein [Pseudoxanthomonas sp. JBR18]WCE05664.1 SdrD B-like domain-containing protein [Pseudoxanthomonas sp. JBR18]
MSGCRAAALRAWLRAGFPAAGAQRGTWLRSAALALFALTTPSLAAAADLQLTNLSDTGYDPSPAGATVVYSVTVENSAADTVNDAVVIFDLPAGSQAGTPLPGTCSVAAGNAQRIECRVGTLVGTFSSDGAPVTFQLPVSTVGLAPGTIEIRGAIGVEAGLPAASTPIASLADTDAFFAGDSNAANNRRLEATTLESAGDLSVEKTATPNPVVAGAEVTYTVTVRNAGPSSSAGFRVVDTLPAAVQYVANSFNGSGWTFNSGSMTATHAGALANGGSSSFTFRARVTAASGNIINTARVEAGGTPDPLPDNNTGSVTTAVTAGADLALSKSVNPSPAISGQPVTFNIQVRNQGPSAAVNPRFVDNLPTGFVVTGGTAATGWTCTDSNGNATRACALNGSLAVGAVADFTIESMVPASGTNSSGDVTNSATVTSDTPDANTVDNTGSTTFTVLADGADLSLQKTKTPALVPVWSGVGSDQDSRMTSTIVVRNLGPRAATGQVQAVDTLASGEELLQPDGTVAQAGVAFAAGAWTCVVDQAYSGSSVQHVSCDLGAGSLPLAVGAQAPTLQLLTRARSSSANLLNNACTGGSGGSIEPLTGNGIDRDPETGNDCSGAGTRTTDERADLSITKQTNGPGDGDNVLAANQDTLSYTLTVTNNGPDSTTGVVVNDTVPGFVNGRTQISVTTTPAGWNCTINNASVVCRSGTTALGNGATAQIVIQVKRALFDSYNQAAGTCGGVAISGAFCNTAGVGIDAAVAGSVGELNGANNQASDWIRIARVANVATTAKTISSGTPGRAGVNTTYVMSYINRGPSTVPGVIFRDVFTLPANDSGFVLVSAQRTGAGNRTCTATAGAGVTVTVDAGGTSYANPTGTPAQVTVQCPALASLTNEQTETLQVVIRPNVNSGNTGRQFDNTADFVIDLDGDGNGDATAGTDGDGNTYDFNTDTSDDSKSAQLPFEAGQVDLITNKVDTGFTGGVDPLGYDAINPSANLITYRVTIRNNGPSVATDVRLTDTFTPPSGRTVTFIGASPTPTGSFDPTACAISSGSNPTVGVAQVLECVMPGIGFSTNVAGVVASGQTSTLYLRYRYDTAPGASGDTVTNLAQATSAETDSNTANNSASQETTIRASADMGVSKHVVTTAPDADPDVALPANATSVGLRQPFFYVIDGINNGPGASLSRDRSGSSPLNGTGTVVSDTLPAGLVVVGQVTWQKKGPVPGGGGGEVPNGTGSCTQASATLTCTLGDITVGGKLRIVVPVRWDTYPGAASINNTATIATEQVDRVPGNNTATAPILVTRASLAGTVFEDRDRAGANGGIQQNGEPGIAGVTLVLSGTDAYGNAVNRSTTTAADGRYSFDNLAAAGVSGYTLTQTQPTGYRNGPVDPPTAGASAPSLGGTYAAGNPDSGYTTIPVGAADAALRYDFPEVRRPSLSGRVYVDLNFNNVHDGSDPAIAGATVELLDASTGAVLATTSTDGNGAYRFDDLDPTLTYSVREPLPSGQYSNRPSAINPGQIGGAACASGSCVVGTAVAAPGGPDAASTDRISQIQLGAGLDGTEFNFGENPSGSAIQGRVWRDDDDDGVIDPTETGLADVELVLTGTDQNGQAVNLTTRTDATGNYSFLGLLPGTYTVTEPNQPSGTLNGETVPGDRGGTATPVTTIPSAIASIVLGANQQGQHYDFGEVAAASLSGRVYYDNDDNGVVGSDESGIANVRVVLTGTDDLGAAVQLSVQTDAQGQYRFENLRPGTYTVTEPDQPADTRNGLTTAGTVGSVTRGTATPRETVPSAISAVVLAPGAQSTDNNFGEIANTPDLVVSKLADPVKFTVNNAATYTISVRNIGPRPTAGVYQVQDRLPPGVTLAALPTGSGWTCTGAVGADRFSCEATTLIAPGQTAGDRIQVQVAVGAAAATGSPVNNAVLVQGGGEDAAHSPSAAERGAFDGDVTQLPVCDPAITQNACRLPTQVQLAASVSGTVWFDIGNEDTMLDGGDQRLQSWIVELVDPASGQVVKTTLSAADGSYRFGDVIPAKKWHIRFRDPSSGVIWAFPVSGETASGAAASCAADAAISNGGTSSCRVSDGGVSQLEVVLKAGENLPQQSLPVDPSGVVYDAVTRDPVPGSIVTLAPVGVCAGYDPATSLLNTTAGGYRIEGNAVSMTVGNDGYYQFLFGPAAPARCEFALTVTPPGGYVFVSTLIPAEGNSLSPSGAVGSNYQVQPNALAPTGPVGTATQYYLRLFAGSATAGIVHNHIPLDTAVTTGLAITKTGDRQTAEVGDTVQYTITIRQTAGSALQTVNVVDRLPRGFTYIDGTARANGAAAPEPLGKPGPILGFTTGPIQVGQQIALTYRVRVGVGAQQGDGINRAQAHGCSIAGGCIDPVTMQPLSGSLPSNQAQYHVRVTGGVFTDEGCVLGKVFVDCNANHVQDREELGIPGVRLYFEDGTWVVSDSEGKYSYCGLPPQSHTLKVDASTLPVGARLTTSSNRNLGDADSLFIDLKNGELHRADFVEGSCSNPVIEQVKARRTQGEVRAPESETGQAPLRFSSKPLRAPQQATDSSNQQPIVKPRGTPPPDASVPAEVQP